VIKGETIPEAKGRRARLIGTSHTCSPNFSRLVMEIKVMLPGDYLQHHVVFGLFDITDHISVQISGGR
jgi:hypothetical protein